MMNQPVPRILHLTPTVGKRSAGIGAVALNLTRAQARLGQNVQLWSVDGPEELRWASASFGVEADRLRGFEGNRFGIPALSSRMEREAARIEKGGVEILHLHGLWTGVSRVTNIARRTHGIPAVVAPHGSLQQWALRKSRWKKRLALAWYEDRNLRESSCLHAVGANEVADCRDFGLRNPVAVIPNGISEEWLGGGGDAAAFRRRFVLPEGKRILLFLSRVSPKKGLMMLLDAVQGLGGDFAGWQLVIAGPDEFGHRAEVEAAIRKKGLNGAVRIVGPIFDQVKRDAYAAADLFVLPSYSEGAPVVILEALASQVPVLTTKASPWRELESRRCGWWVDINAEAIRHALRDALHHTPEDLQGMGGRGRELVASSYAWTTSARMTIELYDWLLGRGERPPFVVTD